MTVWPVYSHNSRMFICVGVNLNNLKKIMASLGSKSVTECIQNSCILAWSFSAEMCILKGMNVVSIAKLCEQFRNKYPDAIR
jgi:hypothetical protein